MDTEIKKVPLKEFIDSLQQLYDEGFVYVDIVGKPHKDKDYIGIVVHDEYCKAVPVKEFDINDLNQLI
jgi:flagellar biosynthesis GTPase FlhF